jgi:hypothetical protein
VGPTELGPILAKSLRQVARKHRGQPEWKAPREAYSVWHVVRVFMTCALLRVCPWVLYERLKRFRHYRRTLGLPKRLISLSQGKKRMNTPQFLRALFAFLGHSARRALKLLGSGEVRVVAMDLTRIESDPDQDPHGNWGKDSGGHFWGYKLGLITSENGVILGMTLMRGNWVELNVNRRLLKMARDVVRTCFGDLPIDYVVCDAGFDGESTFKTAHQELKASVICPAKRRRNPKAKSARRNLLRAMRRSPHRFRDQALWDNESTREIFRKRSGIERVNGQLKDTAIRIHEIPPRRRGLKRLLPLCVAKLIIYNLALFVNAQQGLPLRSLKWLVG